MLGQLLQHLQLALQQGTGHVVEGSTGYCVQVQLGVWVVECRPGLPQRLEQGLARTERQ
ncbi:hypothetical protein D3C79_1070870 [compost metagenome]